METYSRQFERLVASTLTKRGVKPAVAANIASWVVDEAYPRAVVGTVVIDILPHPTAAKSGPWARVDQQIVEVRDDIGEIAGIVAHPSYQPILAQAA